MRRGHRGAADGVIAAALPGRVDADAGGDNVNVSPIVREVSEGVVYIGAARGASTPACLPVEVSQRRDRDHFGVGGWHEGIGIAGTVARCYDVGYPCVHRVADCLAQRATTAIVAFTTAAAEAHIRHLNRLSVGRDVVDATDDGRPAPTAGVVQHADRPETRAGRN